MSADAAAPTAARRWRPECVVGWMVALLFAVAGALVLPRVGISWDEPTERTRGELLVDYWSSGGRDTSILEHLDSAYYGNLFVATATLAERVAATVPWYHVWHALVLLTGALGVGLAGRLAGDLSGARAGGLAALLLATTPRWFGHALFNPKDVPFAAAYALAVVALTRLAAEGSRPRATTWAVFGATVGLACAIRMGGLVLLPMGALVVSSAWIGERPAAWRSAAAGLAGGSLLAAGSTVAVLLPFWPLLHRAPVHGLLDILSVQASFPWYSKVLFAGEWVAPRAIAHVYLPTWLWIGLPLGWAVGLAAAPFARLQSAPGAPSAGRERLAVALAALLPVAFVVLRGVPLYDGLRQMLFVLPPLAALAATGWLRLLALRRPPLARGLAAALLALLLVEPIAWIARSGALAYTYVQPLAGSFDSATWRYDSDYWALGLRPLAGELDRLASSRSAADPLRVRVVRPGYLKRSMAPFLADPARVRWLGADDDAPAEVEVVVGRWLRDPVPATEEVLFRSEIIAGQRPFAYLRRAAHRPEGETTAISSSSGSPSSRSSTDPGTSP